MIEIADILKIAQEKGASDVHLTVGIPPKFRINGELHTAEGYDRLMPPDTQAVAFSIMNDRQKAHFEEHGECDLSFSIPSLGRYRLNVYRQRGSCALSIRLVSFTVPTPEELGIPQTVADLCSRKRGLVLATGPTGAGKSTTLASLVDRINHTREAHIITLEDPIEFLHRHDRSIVDQREIGLDADSYASALRSTLREDPDIIMVGEMRDLETISIAITAAETGHLVFSTLHTTGATSTVDRIIDVFPPHQQQQVRVQLAGVLECVISQQLVPRADGHGRVAAFEVMHANPAVRNLIREGKSHQLTSVIQTSHREGSITMDEFLTDLYQKKIITADTAVEYATDTSAMRLKTGIGMQGTGIPGLVR